MSKQINEMPVRYKTLNGGSDYSIKWERSLDLIFSPGTFTVEIDHTHVDVGLPMEFCGDEHYIVGTLVVTDSGTAGTTQKDRVTGQILMFTDRESKETRLYVRTFADETWNVWRSFAYAGMFENVSTTDELIATVEGLVGTTKTTQEHLLTEISRAMEEESEIKKEASLFKDLIDENRKEINHISSRIEKKKLILSELGFYTSYGLTTASGSKAMNTGVIYFRGYEKLVYCNALDTAAYAVAFFDAAHNLLKDISIKNETVLWDERVVDLSDSKYAAAEYLAVSCYDGSSAFTQFSAVLESPDSIEQRLMQMENIPIPKSEEIFEKRPQLVDYGYYGTNGGKTNTNNAMNTGIVSVDGYKKIEYNTKISSGGAEIVFYDKSKNFIEGLSISGRNSLDANTIDLSDAKYANVGYIVISYYDGTGEYAGYNVRLYSDNTLETRVAGLERIEAIMPSNNRPLNILIFGDSITDSATITVNEQQQTTLYNLLEKGSYMSDETGATVRFSMWPYLITKYLPCHDMRDYAKSGASYTEKAREAGNERQNLSYQIQLALNDKSNPNGVFPTVGDFIPDVIIFALGTNDGTPTGSYDEAMSKTIMSADGNSFNIDATLDNLDITKTCDAIRYAFLKVKHAFPQSLCFCVLPIQRAGSEKPGINDVLEKMARRYSIKVIDGAAELGVVRDLEVSNGNGACLKDGLHPNDKGQRLYARMMVNAIKNNWIDL